MTGFGSDSEGNASDEGNIPQLFAVIVEYLSSNRTTGILHLKYNTRPDCHNNQL